MAGSEPVPVTLKLPKEIFEELQLRVPEGERSEFIREAIIEKLSRTPKPNPLLRLEERMRRLEEDLAGIKSTLASLELLSYNGKRVDPYAYCEDEKDRAIIELLLQKDGLTTPEVARGLEENRWLVLNRLKKIQERSIQKLGRPIVSFYASSRMGKKRAWWINRELVA
ncbi:MAG: ribbon-helix-helix domain-containing protein [Candidatus Bathyarchaeia archaeon]